MYTFRRLYASRLQALALFCFALAAHTVCGQTRTWSGEGDNDNWSTANNWGGIAPTGGESVVFGGATRLTNVNDLVADIVISNITFNSGSGPFRLTGSRVTLDGTVVNNDDSTQKITLPLVLSATRTFNAAGAGTLAVDGEISGAGGLTKTGANILFLQTSNSYDGATTVSSGILRINSAYALGSAAAGTVVADNARVELDGSITVTNESITTTGNGGSGSNIGGLQSVNGFNTWAGNVTIVGSNARIGCAGGIGTAQLTVAGVIDDGPSTLSLFVRNADGGGPTVLSGASTYGGDTQLVVGYLRLAGGDNRLPTNTLLRIGNSSNVAFAQFNLNGCSQQVGGLKSEGSGMGTAITNSSGTAATLTVNIAAASTTNLYGGTLAGNLSLVKSGSGDLTLTNNAGGLFNDVRVLGGTITVGSPNALRGGTLDADYGATGSVLFGTNLVATLGGLKGSNGLDLVNSRGAGMTLAIGYNNQSTLYSGVLSGGALAKVGSGTLTLTGLNTYTGRTVVSGGKLAVFSEGQLGTEPATLVTNQLTFDGGTLAVTNSFRLGPSNRGVALGAGGATLEVSNENSTLAVSNTLTGAGSLTKNGIGLLTLTTANTFDGGMFVNAGVVRLFNSGALGSTLSGTTVMTGSQLELANGLKVSGERIRINGLGLGGPPKPPTSPDDSRGALQAAVGATAEWAGTVILGSTDARVGTQNGGHLIVSGVVTDEGLNYTFRTSSDPSSRTRGVLLTATNAYGGRTEVTRGTLFLGTTNALPVASVLNVHWSSANFAEYAALDLNGFDQTVGGLMNSGVSGGNAVVTNSSLTEATLTVNQASATDFNGILAGNLALVKSGAGTLTLTNRNRYSGGTTVSGGTLRFGVASALPSSASVTLSGGTLDLAGTTNTLSLLTVAASSTLALGAGKLTFSAQSADAWSGVLTLTGTLGPATLRFVPALTAAQLEQVRYDGKRVTQNSAGYVVPYRGTLIMGF